MSFSFVLDKKKKRVIDLCLHLILGDIFVGVENNFSRQNAHTVNE